VTPRLRTDFWVSALRRRAEAAGAFVAIARKGADQAGAVFVGVTRRDGLHDLYGPAPQSFFEDDAPADRIFMRYLTEATGEALATRMESEIRFDPDLWLIDIDDASGRPFIEVRDAEA
jgi:hypothetical protein